MEIISTILPGVKIIRPKIHSDERGFFLESYNFSRYSEFGVDVVFVQDNHSRSSRNVLRGLHYQKQYPQGKLVRVTLGRVLDVVADVNPMSLTYGKYISIELDAIAHTQIYIPPGYAHGFLVLSDKAEFLYKCTDFYRPGDESGVMWNDKFLNINWPIDRPLLSSKDSSYLPLKEF